MHRTNGLSGNRLTEQGKGKKR